MSPSAHHDSLPEHPDPDLTAYRPVSGWGVAALLVGLASAVALAHPLLWSVPLVGVVVAVIALRRIRRSEIKLLGRKAAIVGLAFSLIYGVAAPAHLLSRNHWLAARAQRLADEFIELVRTHQVDRAFALTLKSAETYSPRRRPMPGENPETAPKTQEEAFLAEPPVSTLVSLGTKAHITHLETVVYIVEGGRQSVGVLYEVHYQGEHTLNPLEVLVYVEQSFDAKGHERWWISSVSTPPLPQLSM